MLTSLQLQQAIQRAGDRARNRVRSGELDPWTGEVGRVLTQCLLMAEIRASVVEAVVAQAGLPAGSDLVPLRTFDGSWALAVNRPNRKELR